jgi:tripartite-type tricarboxylate transporter receptor subunit TctC
MKTPLVHLAAALALCGAAAAAHAQAWPSRAVTLTTPLATGSASDVALRIVADKLAASLGQSLVIENQTGASGAIGADKVARATPDGYTLCGCNNAILGVLPHVRKVPYDPVKSFRPVGMVAVLPTAMVVHPDLPVKNVPELVAYIKANPGKVSYATGGQGSAQHIAMAMFETATGTKMLHVPYKGPGPGLIDLLAGRVSAMTTSITAAFPHVRAGRLRVLGVTTAQRVAAIPEVLTIAEGGVPGYESVQWWGLLVPAATPADIVARLNRDVVAVMHIPDIKERFEREGMVVIAGTPQEFAAFMRAETVKWAKIVKSAGIQPE